jgi:hypothetical protein
VTGLASNAAPRKARDGRAPIRAASRVFLETLLEQTTHAAWQTGWQTAPIRIALDNAGDDARVRIAVENALPAEHFEQHAAESPDIGAPVDLAAARLLRAHVRRRADRPPLNLSQLLTVPRPCIRCQGLRDAEVEHLDRAVGANLDIRWLQIAVNDALLVRGIEGPCDLLGDIERIGERNPPATRRSGNELLDCRAVNEFHDQRLRIAIVLEAVQRRDIRMIQRGQQARLALESLNRLGVGSAGLRQNLERDLTFEFRIARAIDLAHATHADQG